MPRRIHLVDTARQHGDGAATDAERSPVGDAIDPPGRAGDDDHASCGEVARHLSGRRFAVRGRRPCADDCDRRLRRERRRVTSHPEGDRRVRAEIAERARPAGIARGQQPGSGAGGELDGVAEGRGIPAWTPPPQRGRPHSIADQTSALGITPPCAVEGSPCAPLRDRRARHAVTRFDESAPHDRRIAVVAELIVRKAERIGTRAHRTRICRGAVHAAIPRLRYSARPMSSPVRRSCPARSATLQATRSTRS